MMRSPRKTKLLMCLLTVGAVVGFASGFHHLAHCRQASSEGLTRVCVDAVLGRAPAPTDEWTHHGHRARWVAERCAAHAREGRAP